MSDNQDTADRISFFLNTFFSTLHAMELGFAIHTDKSISIIDVNTKAGTKLTPSEFQQKYNDWAKNR